MIDNQEISNDADNVVKNELVIVRTFEAPRELVWKAWMEPERFMRWWGPAGFTMTVLKMDFRPGGVFHYAMRSPDGQEMWGKFVYREIAAPERIVFINSFSDQEGNLIRHPMVSTWPLQILNTLTLSEQGTKTKLTLRGGPYSATEAEWQTFNDALVGVHKGFTGTFDQLTGYLKIIMSKGEMDVSRINLIAEPRKQEITIKHSFDAPRDLVFKAFTDPNLIPQWWGPRSLVTHIDRMDVRPGGDWRFVQRDAGGNEFAFHGIYHEVTPSERLVYTFEFEGMPGHILLETVTFEEQGGKTLMTDQSVFQSVADRDGMLSSGMEQGASESMERITELLAKIALVK
jgi:uncharacterized protein YndB with AHSA1/START domain